MQSKANKVGAAAAAEVKLNENQTAICMSYADSLRKATSAALTAGQRGAWTIACFMQDGLTMDESLAAVRSFLKGEGLPASAIERSRPLIPAAIAFREAGEKYPAKGWPTIALAKAIAARAGKSVGELLRPAVWNEACEMAFEAARCEMVEAMAAKGVDGDPSAESVETRVRTGAPKATREGNAEGAGIAPTIAAIGKATLAELDAFDAAIAARRAAIKAARNTVA